MSQKICIICGLPTERVAYIGTSAKPFCKECSDSAKEKAEREAADKRKETKEIITKTIKNGLIILL